MDTRPINLLYTNFLLIVYNYIAVSPLALGPPPNTPSRMQTPVYTRERKIVVALTKGAALMMCKQLESSRYRGLFPRDVVL